jgi:DNA-binding NarL/FixJ family response regulator
MKVLRWRLFSPDYLDSLLVAFSPDGRPYDPGSLHPGRTSQPAKSTEHVPQQPLLDPLSKRELEVLRLLARGGSNQEIAEVLGIALNTVHHHVSNILSKLEVSNRIQAMAQACALGLLPEGPF